MNTLDAIVEAEFVATEEQVLQLAGIAAEGRRAGGTYLKVLFAHVKATLTKKRKPSRKVQVEVVDETHTRLYACVLKGVGPDDLEVNERNRRATFARTAASTLRHFAKKGRKPITVLPVVEVTKTKLRRLSGSVPAGTRTERVLTRSTEALLRTSQRLAKSDPKGARKRIVELQAELTKILAKLDEKKAPAVKVKAAMKRKGAPARIVRQHPYAGVRNHRAEIRA